MRKSFDNIEYNKFPGQKHYVGYAPLSGVWRIKGTTGRYVAFCQSGRDPLGSFCADSLAECSSLLSFR